MSDRYVYILFREFGVPLYVGKGRGRRMHSHESDACRERTHKAAVIRKILAAGGSIKKTRIVGGMTNAEACELEQLLIATIGRKHDGGPLTNVTAGGEGNYDPTPEHRERLSLAHRGIRPSLETRAKLRAAKKGFRPSAAVRKAANDARRGMIVPATVRTAIAQKLAGRVNGPPSAETRRKISEAQRGQKRSRQSDEAQAKRGASVKAAWALLTAEQRSKRGMFGRRHSPETIAKMRAARVRIAAIKALTKSNGTIVNDTRIPRKIGVLD